MLEDYYRRNEIKENLDYYSKEQSRKEFQEEIMRKKLKKQERLEKMKRQKTMRY